ncbi:MAG: hypothetical protein LBU70_04055 [Chitinispirillales bacterium]|jgi:hypothetical protein|nr:hypothetical protein [Chitinispirillales bacterium]
MKVLSFAGFKKLVVVVFLLAGVAVGNNAPSYSIYGSSSGFNAAREGGGYVAMNTTIVDAIGRIRDDADGLPCVIMFGRGAGEVLNVGSAGLTFSGAGWGDITLIGSVTSSGMATITLDSDFSVYNTADIQITNPNGSAVVLQLQSNFVHMGGNITGSIINNGNGEVVVSGTATVTSESMAGTIINPGEGGSVVITGGKISNTTDGSVVRNSAINGRVVISGNAEITSASVNGVAIHSTGGFVDISGSTISNTAGGHAVSVERNAPDGFVPMLSVSGTARLTSNGHLATLRIFGNGSREGGNSDIARPLTRGGTVNISGGMIINTADTALSVPAVLNDGGRLTISGTAEIVSKATNQPVRVQVAQGYFWNTIYGAIANINQYELYVLGGKIASSAADSGVAISHSARIYCAGELYLGGNPDVDGFISMSSQNQSSPNQKRRITTIASGDSIFVPGERVYPLLNVLADGNDGDVVVRNGARFTSNFSFVPSFSPALIRPAARGNDVVIAGGRTYTIAFNLNGGLGTPPAPISVVEGSMLGEFAKPPAEGHVNGGGFMSDKEWYRSAGMTADGQWHIGPRFVFNTSVGTVVDDDMTLLLLWTSETNSTLEADREIPDSNDSDTEIAVVAPIIIVVGEFTAGPNPMARQSDYMNFFWTGKTIRNGNLLVYDAQGNVVNSLTVSDAADNTGGRRIVCAWNLTDRRGKAVADGTYLVRGTIVLRDGKKEKVSTVVGVR